jgi:hypothetical protein
MREKMVCYWPNVERETNWHRGTARMGILFVKGISPRSECGLASAHRVKRAHLVSTFDEIHVIVDTELAHGRALLRRDSWHRPVEDADDFAH